VIYQSQYSLSKFASDLDRTSAYCAGNVELRVSTQEPNKKRGSRNLNAKKCDMSKYEGIVIDSKGGEAESHGLNHTHSGGNIVLNLSTSPIPEQAAADHIPTSSKLGFKSRQQMRLSAHVAGGRTIEGGDCHSIPFQRSSSMANKRNMKQ